MTEPSKQTDYEGGEFLLGEWHVFPDRNQLDGPGGAQTIAPMSMKLLVLLVENAPRTTTRDEIVDRLWDGRVVTEDAINKQISKLRNYLESHGAARGIVQTVAKVGVRLGAEASAAPVSSHRTPSPRAKRPRLILSWRGAVLAALIVLVAIAAWMVLRRDNGEFVVTQEPATSMVGTEIEPALSPDGRWLAFTAQSEPRQSSRLFVRPTDSETERLLTPRGVSAHVPSWSTDGRLAFAIRDRQGCSLAVSTPDGPYRVVTRCGAVDIGGLAWLDPDHLVVSERPQVGQSFRLEIVDLRNGSRRQLTTPPAGQLGDFNPFVARQTGQIYFLRRRSVGPSELHSVSRSGDVQALTDEGATINGAAAGPEGTILISAQRNGRGYSLWSFDVETRRWRELQPGPAAGLTSTADGRFAIFSRPDRQTTLWQLPITEGDGQALAASTGVDWTPALSPDRSRLAFLSDRSGKREIWVLQTGTGNLRRLTNFGGRDIQDLSWSRHGRTIATSVPVNGQFDIQLIDVVSGRAQPLVESSADERFPVFTANGRLWYVRRGGARFDLIEFDPVLRRHRLLLQNVMRAVPDPTATYAYFTRPFANGIWRADLSGGEAVKLTDWPDATRFRNFTVDERGLWSTRDRDDGAWLMFTDARTRQTRPMRALPQLAYPSGLEAADQMVIYARLRREEANLFSIRFSP